jgi:hypothetical protein
MPTKHIHANLLLMVLYIFAADSRLLRVVYLHLVLMIKGEMAF